MSHRLSTIDAAVKAIARGEIVVVMDAEDRENEGDFICAAEKVTPDIVNFMITNGRGQLCMPLLPEVCQRLDLPPMVDENTAPLGTNFTVPVDHCTLPNGDYGARAGANDPGDRRSGEQAERFCSSRAHVPLGG